MNYKQILLDKINKLINGSLSVPEFEKEYYNFYLNEVPGNVLNEAEHTFFGWVQEKLDWTAQAPTDQEFHDGYFNYEGYIDWVKKNTAEFTRDEKEWYKKYLDS